MKYLPISNVEKVELLRSLGAEREEDLFRSIPGTLKKATSSGLDSPKSEIEIRRFFQSDAGVRPQISFLGGNGHHHYIPSIIDPIISRGEFLTAYTPYQPEISQGTLQSMFEFQSMMANLMGVEVSNASLYDGSTAMMEAALMAARITGKHRILVSEAIHPEYLETMRTYCETTVLEFETVPTEESGATDLNAIRERLAAGGIGAVVLQSPNFYGIIEDIKAVADAAREKGALSVTVTTEALSLAYLRSPGSLGADIVCGEGQSLGIPLSFGGPWLGFIGNSMEYVRNMPGRLVGETKDKEGKRAFVVTLAAREQHIRREKATTNICTNQGLMTVRAAIYMSVMGKTGLYRAAERSAKFAHYARSLLSDSATASPLHPDAPIFNEFVVETQAPARRVFDLCMERGIAPGNIISDHRLLCAFNETMSPEIVDRWAKAVQEAAKV
jgi:glycine dehydrogenase subunit 1